MVEFVRFREINEHEGERWNWWLQRDGNQDALLKLEGLVDENCDYDVFVLDLNDVLTEEQVDLLTDYADEGYYASHNKVIGILALPDTVDDDALYKGRIRDLFRKA